MASLAELSSAQLAEQLRNPNGATGVAVAEALGSINAGAIAAISDRLDLQPSMAVLELGCGLGNFAPLLAASMPGVTYTGVDRSPTMAEAATVRHSAHVASGCAKFVCASSEQTGLNDSSFERLFSIGLIHFWSEPLRSLKECRRLLRAGGMVLMACLGPDRPPPFALAEYGFHLRSPAEWRRLAGEAGFGETTVEVDETAGRPQGLLMISKR